MANNGPTFTQTLPTMTLAELGTSPVTLNSGANGVVDLLPGIGATVTITATMDKNAGDDYMGASVNPLSFQFTANQAPVATP